MEKITGKKFVKYTRVSTRSQGQDGHGMAAQHRDIEIFMDNYTTDCEIIKEFSEVVSGKDDGREEFNAAIEYAKKHKAILLVSKLDRLSRKVSTIATLMDDKRLEFKVACMPNADKFQLHLYAALAEQEREFISQRTKAGLAAAKAKGVKLGGNRGNIDKANAAAAKAADEKAEQHREMLQTAVDAGKSLREIAKLFNRAGLRTARGAEFNAPQISRMLKRLGIKPGNPVGGSVGGKAVGKGSAQGKITNNTK